MLDIKFIRNNSKLVKEATVNKGMEVDVDKLLALDEKVLALIKTIELLRQKRNSLTKEIKKTRSELIKSDVRLIKTEIAEFENKLNSYKREFDDLMLKVPSIPATEVPIGHSEDDNLELKKWGNIPEFDFPPKNHVELAENLDIVDFSRAVKFAGSRSYFLKNEGVLLEQAITRYVLDFLIEKGFVALGVPVMVRDSAMIGTGYFPIGYEQAYKLKEDDLYLVGTSEVSLVSYHQNEILDYKDLPLKYTGMSTCFRREAGAAGQATKGLYRVHQFQKVEQVIICDSNSETSDNLHYELLNNVEEIMQSLKLPYRVALACSGEIGIGQIRKHEVETWMPSRGGYCETHSCSTMGDFQARRSNIRYRDQDGSIKFAYTLNNTGIASPRILIPLLELNQQKDGSVMIPDVLQPYMNNNKFIHPKNT